MMSFVRQFTKSFGNCLTDEAWLPFRRPPDFAIQAPSTFYIINEAYKFQLMTHGLSTGNITVQPNPEAETLTLIDLSVASDDKAYVQSVKIELARRAINYAFERGYRLFETKRFKTNEAAFWLGLGLNEIPATPTMLADAINWRALNPSELAQTWQQTLRDDPVALREFAQTDIGKQALQYYLASGALDFTDEAQRAYVFERLDLPYRKMETRKILCFRSVGRRAEPSLFKSPKL